MAKPNNFGASNKPHLDQTNSVCIPLQAKCWMSVGRTAATTSQSSCTTSTVEITKYGISLPSRLCLPHRTDLIRSLKSPHTYYYYKLTPYTDNLYEAIQHVLRYWGGGWHRCDIGEGQVIGEERGTENRIGRRNHCDQAESTIAKRVKIKQSTVCRSELPQYQHNL